MNALRVVSYHRQKPHFASTLLALSLLTLSACSTTKKAEIDVNNLHCGLLGPNCAGRLVPGGEDQLGMRYVSPDANFTAYNQVLISPVTYWGGESSEVSAADQQSLVNFFDQELEAYLGKQFKIVQQAGPGVLKIDVAMTDAEAATPVLRSITMIVPQARLLSSLKNLATDSYPFAGGAQAEIRISDSVTGKVLFEGLDKRIGGNAFKTGFQWQWGDAENAINTWCDMLATRLAAATSGRVKP